MSDEELDDVDQRLDEIEERIREASRLCYNRSVIRIAREGRRLAKQEHRLIPFLSFSFHLINSADDVLDMKQGNDVAVEMIALLEDEELARSFQSDLPMDEYEHTKWWLTGFTYKKLATLTGHAQGYNSDGMHQCISDGMTVCRRTGNLRDTLHFREFAVEVYRSADDLEMALHFARGSLHLQDADDANRKVASADDVATLLSLQGNIAAAVEMVQEGWQYCLEFHNPYLAKLNFLPLAREVLAVAGRQDLLAKLPRIVTEDEVIDLPEDQLLRIPPQDECPYFKYLRDQSLAVEVACAGNAEEAIRLLHPWDRQLHQEQCLNRWFGVRCRLIAACRMAGRLDQARTLAKSCEDVARQSRDWLTLRRLKWLLDESVPVTPLAIVGVPDCGTFASRPAFESTATHNTEIEPPSVETPVAGADSPLSPLITSLYERLEDSEGESEAVAVIADELLAIDPASISDHDDAGRLLHLVRFVTGAAQSRAVLAWAQRILEHHPAQPMILSMFAALAAHLRELPGADLDDVVSPERVEAMFRQSLDLDFDSPTNFARAGIYYVRQENFGEAERCLARSYRLDRTSPIVALSLAEVYSMTDRPRDALAVLDMALRDGADDPQLAWEAALRANNLEQFEAALAYLDRFESEMPDHAWTNHYRAFSLLELNRPAEALAALDREAQNNADAPYPTQLQRVTAFGLLKAKDEFRQQLMELLSIPLTSVTYLSPAGLQRLFHRLWASADLLTSDDPLRRVFEDFLVATGLAANDFFDAIRVPSDGSKPKGEVQFFRVIVRQPLDQEWRTSPGCLASDQDWIAYSVAWGVLAADEADARQRVLEWQQRCYPLPAEVHEVESSEETYQDFPGIVWQGQREGELPPD